MGLFSKKETLAEIEGLKTQLSESHAKVETLEAEAKTSEEVVKTLNETITTHNESIADLTSKLEVANEAIETHEEATSDFDKKVDARAIEIAAQAGAAPVEETENNEDDNAAILREYKSMPAGEARAAFRKQNANLIK